MKIGYNEATAMGCSDLATDLALCEKNGFDYIELRLDMLKEYLKQHSVSELKQFFQSSKIKPHALNALYTFPDFCTGKSPDDDKILLDDFIWGCDIAHEIGAQYFIIVPPLQRDPNGGPFIGSWQDTRNNCIRILERLSDIAKPYGIKLCLELVGFERSSVRTVEQAWDIVQAVSRDNVGLVFDAFNLYLYNQLNDFSVMKLVDVDKIYAVHINNGDASPDHKPTQALRRFCDSGVVNVHQFLAVLKEMNYTGMVSIETFRPEYWEKSPEWVVAEAYRTTKQLMVESGVFCS
ncbi:sugar phosphate isomerase/epimerase family protein [Zophobihabitans entericus]|uniref:Sugar phosphate isomerase/epimerase n=1 Tax=Zophobihabitans entericus TaxID=1635327 RepID=A0A6G9I8J2_9GAMM|nr:sugar phosphate isomerase/epimerase [Zophobihabitans entericus]QIQ20538.1 sugar phosphate isomerase/epimerase [Zophobihabitans entericus]